MSESYRGKLPVACPRCKVKLPPGETSCYNCGFQIAHVRSTKQKRRTLIYFICVFLFLVLSAAYFVRSTGISFSALFSKKTPPSRIVYPLPTGTPFFSDNFSSDANGWNLQSSPGNYTVTLNNGTLTMEIDKNQLLWELLPGERTYSNLTLIVNAALKRGDQNNGYGVYIRGAANAQSDLAADYRFELYGDGSYAIFKGVTDASGTSTDTKIVNYTLNAAIKKEGGTNQIMIIARGPNLSFVVNGQLLKTITDTSYASGSVALFISNLPEAKPGMQVQFSQFAIYPLHA
ncbi:MAG TPA: family 16 glycoside hydrolase [Ktedonobacteraceae bacterium]